MIGTQLDLFTSTFAYQVKLDSLLKTLIQQGCNIRYLITRTNYCGDLTPAQQLRLSQNLEKTLINLEALCNELKSASYFYYKTDFSKFWAYSPYVTMTESVCLSDILSHQSNCYKRYKTAILSNYETFAQIGPIVDRIGKLLYYSVLS